MEYAWLLAMKGFAGCGKSTLARALSSEMGWPLIDKDDVKDILDGHAQAAGPLAYAIMFNIARRQLLQGLSVICDSPLTGSVSYERAQRAAAEAHASLVVVKCICSDESLWQQRIDGRKTLQLPAHHQTDWHAYQSLLRQSQFQEHQYPVTHPHIVIDTAQPLQECLTSILSWLDQL
ncbi:MAG TPA: AAA family ATPase [Ktedonosporobacter sp.]|jgi:predicted kinase|nr:AAA family ATPase [Ktedonosporobacter sp.]